jgi:hypothetical protein
LIRVLRTTVILGKNVEVVQSKIFILDKWAVRTIIFLASVRTRFSKVSFQDFWGPNFYYRSKVHVVA